MARIEARSMAVARGAKRCEEVTLTSPDLDDLGVVEGVPFDQVGDEIVGVALEHRRVMERVLVGAAVRGQGGVERRVVDVAARFAEDELEVPLRRADRVIAAVPQDVAVDGLGVDANEGRANR